LCYIYRYSREKRPYIKSHHDEVDKKKNALTNICSGGDMQGFNVSMTRNALAFASSFIARQIKATTQGRVKAPGIHLGRIAGLNPMNISNVNSIANVRQG
jgi:hypothetical protein